MEQGRLLELIGQGENDRTEFKRFGIVKRPSEFCAGLVALANRYGGSLLLGLNNDGSREGTRIDPDELVTDISNLAKDRCSPAIAFNFQHHRLVDGDVLAIEIRRRQSIPSAVIERGGHEIKGRTYYIRTANGKRLVEDKELEWLFKNTEDPNFESRFRVSVVYNRKTIGIAFGEMPHFFLQLIPFLEVPEPDRDYLLADEGNRVKDFIIELLPFALLHHFAWIFRNSWLVEIVRRKNETRIQTKPVPSPKKEIELSKILPPKNSAIINNLTAKPWDVFGRFPGTISLPDSTSVKIDLGPQAGSPSRLTLHKDQAFDFMVTFQWTGWNAGLPWGHPRRIQRMLTFQEYNPDEGMATVTAECLFDAKFAFPDSPDPDFGEHYEFARLIHDVLRREWDFDSYVRALPNPQLYLIENKIDAVLELLKTLSDGLKEPSAKG